jgi:hypothetical protein
MLAYIAGFTSFDGSLTGSPSPSTAVAELSASLLARSVGLLTELSNPAVASLPTFFTGSTGSASRSSTILIPLSLSILLKTV